MNMCIKNVRIVYFSGTGGTERVAKAFEKALESLEIQPDMLSLNRRNEESLGSSDITIIIYPVHAFDAPEPIYKWIQDQPHADGTRAAVISVSGGGEVWPNTASRVRCIKALERKGFEVFYERMLVMPSNIFINTHDHLSMHLLNVMPAKAEHSIAEIFNGTYRRSRAPMSARIISTILQVEKPAARRFGRKMTINSACNGCGWCESSCPRRNITLVDGRPEFGDRCVACLSCIYGCPNKAINPRFLKVLTVKEGYDLNSLEARMAGVELKPVEDLARGAFAGLYNYLMHMEV